MGLVSAFEDKSVLEHFETWRAIQDEFPTTELYKLIETRIPLRQTNEHLDLLLRAAIENRLEAVPASSETTTIYVEPLYDDGPHITHRLRLVDAPETEYYVSHMWLTLFETVIKCSTIVAASLVVPWELLPRCQMHFSMNLDLAKQLLSSISPLSSPSVLQWDHLTFDSDTISDTVADALIPL